MIHTQTENNYHWSTGPLEIQHHRRSGAFNMTNKHFHDTYEIYYLVSGERYYFIKDRTYHIFGGDIVLINKNDLHKTKTAKAPTHERILINFTEEIFRNFNGTGPELNLLTCFLQKNNLVRMGIDEQNHLRNLLFKMLEESKTKATEYLLYLKITLMEILILLNRHREQSRIQQEK